MGGGLDLKQREVKAPCHERVGHFRKSPLRLDGLDLRLDPFEFFLLAQFRLTMLFRLGLVFLLGLLLLILVVILLPRILANGLVGLLVEFLQSVRFNVVVNVPLKL